MVTRTIESCQSLKIFQNVELWKSLLDVQFIFETTQHLGAQAESHINNSILIVSINFKLSKAYLIEEFSSNNLSQ